MVLRTRTITRIDMSCDVKFTVSQLRHENDLMAGTGGTSRENKQLGFCPAFIDTDTGMVYPSANIDGSLAPVHVLDGLPESFVVNRTQSGHVSAVKSSIVAGFTLAGNFFTREQAAQFVRKSSTMKAC